MSEETIAHVSIIFDIALYIAVTAVVIWGLMIVFFAVRDVMFAASEFRANQREAAGFCATCGYNVSRTVQHRCCPECGGSLPML